MFIGKNDKLYTEPLWVSSSYEKDVEKSYVARYTIDLNTLQWSSSTIADMYFDMPFISPKNIGKKVSHWVLLSEGHVF